ncbi:MAG: hypothetical protein RIS35_2467 [Pseudomonadota bacterium]
MITAATITARAATDLENDIDPEDAARDAAAKLFGVSRQVFDGVMFDIYRSSRPTVLRAIDDLVEETGFDREVLRAVVRAEVEWMSRGD